MESSLKPISWVFPRMKGLRVCSCSSSAVITSMPLSWALLCLFASIMLSVMGLNIYSLSSVSSFTTDNMRVATKSTVLMLMSGNTSFLFRDIHTAFFVVVLIVVVGVLFPFFVFLLIDC